MSAFGGSPPREPGLSPYNNRPISRSSSRTSIRSVRAPSPSVSLDDPVSVRNQISTLKHTIRHQQAQVHDLENIILRGPRPYSNDILSDMHSLASSPPPSYSSPSSPRINKRSSFEVLASIAGPDSNLPLPRRDTITEDSSSSIQEGVPMSFGVISSSPPYKRNSSPTRTLSRIPVSSVGNARALADEGQGQSLLRSSSARLAPPSIDADLSSPTSSSSGIQPPSPNKRVSLTPGGTTKVLADLQTYVSNARHALENTKAQLRLSQRSVAQLTRQTEDLKEGRERLRLENEGLNNVVARKERLLQEVLERARKAETEAATLKSQLKTETSTTKKAMREMETALTESTALSQKSEREYLVLRDSIKSMAESWQQDTQTLRDEMKKREERWKKEAEDVGKKYRLLVEEVKASRKIQDEVKTLKEEDRRVGKEVEVSWLDEIEGLKKEIGRSAKDSDDALEMAKEVAGELARLRRLMRNAGRAPSPPPPP